MRANNFALSSVRIKLFLDFLCNLSLFTAYQVERKIFSVRRELFAVLAGYQVRDKLFSDFLYNFCSFAGYQVERKIFLVRRDILSGFAAYQVRE